MSHLGLPIGPDLVLTLVPADTPHLEGQAPLHGRPRLHQGLLLGFEFVQSGPDDLHLVPLGLGAPLQPLGHFPGSPAEGATPAVGCVAGCVPFGLRGVEHVHPLLEPQLEGLLGALRPELLARPRLQRPHVEQID